MESSLPAGTGPSSPGGEERKGRKWQDYEKIKSTVVQLLHEHPQGLTGAAIAERIGLTPGAVSKYLSMLSVDGIISSRQIGVAKLWKLVTDSDRTGMLAEKISSQFESSFKDYSHTLIDKDGKLTEADGTRVLILSTSTLSNLYDFTRSILGDQVKPFFYEWGREYVKEMKNFVGELAEMTNSTFLETFLSLWKLRGWGRFEINKATDTSGLDRITVTWLDSIWANRADKMARVERNVNSDNKSQRDDFIAGALSMACSFAFGGTWRFIEVECVSSNNSFNACKFEGKKVDTPGLQPSTTVDI